MALQRQPDAIRTGMLSGQRKDADVGARTMRVVFIPWDVHEGAEWNQKTDQWNRVKGDKFAIVNYNPGGPPHPDLVKVSGMAGGVVYIRGHGNPGFPYIMANHRPPGFLEDLGLVLPISDACQRLIDSGLGSDFPGVIKFYSCHSGTKLIASALSEEQRKWTAEMEKFRFLVDAVEKELAKLGPGDGGKKANLEVQLTAYRERLKKHQPEDKAMARQGADYMRSKGFKRCCFYGYLGPLGSLYELETDDSDVWHKTVELDGLNNRPKELKGLDSSRPSVARVRV
jgi:hypothetical protein